MHIYDDVNQSWQQSKKYQRGKYLNHQFNIRTYHHTVLYSSINGCIAQDFTTQQKIHTIHIWIIKKCANRTTRI